MGAIRSERFATSWLAACAAFPDGSAGRRHARGGDRDFVHQWSAPREHGHGSHGHGSAHGGYSGGHGGLGGGIIAERIRSGEYPPEMRLPSESELMEEYELGRSTVRRSMAWLREQGLVETVPTRGTYVAGTAPK